MKPVESLGWYVVEKWGLVHGCAWITTAPWEIDLLNNDLPLQSYIGNLHLPVFFQGEAIQSLFCYRRQLGRFEKYLCHLDLGTGSAWSGRRGDLGRLKSTIPYGE